MRKMQYILSGITLMTLPLGIHAQQQAKDSTVNRTVVVEQEYTPDILDASKINVLPKVEPPTANKRAVEPPLCPPIRFPQLSCRHIPEKKRKPRHSPDISDWATAITGIWMRAPATCSRYPTMTAST